MLGMRILGVVLGIVRVRMRIVVGIGIVVHGRVSVVHWRVLLGNAIGMVRVVVLAPALMLLMQRDRRRYMAGHHVPWAVYGAFTAGAGQRPSDKL